MVRRTRAELREDGERQDARAEKEAWRHYAQGLAQLDDPAAAQRFANSGLARNRPGGRYYDNLGSFLHWCANEPYEEPTSPSAGELDEFFKFLQRAEAAGKKLHGGSAAFAARFPRPT